MIKLYPSLLIFIISLFIHNKLSAGQHILQSQGFEENRGQVQGRDKKDVLYFYKSGNLTIFLTKKGLVYQLENVKQSDSLKADILETYRMDMELVGGNFNQVLPANKDSATINYYNHQILAVPSYQKIVYKNIYPSIDWVIYIEKTQNTNKVHIPKNERIGVKYDFVVHPGGDPSIIKFQPKWVENFQFDTKGNMVLANRLGYIQEQKPYSYQVIEGKQVEIQSKYQINDSEINYQIEEYDRKKELVIDPLLQWATYYGGSAAETGGYTTIDGSGFVYLCGSTASTTTTIASGGFQSSMAGVNDAFLVKFNSSGVRQWATYYGGSDDDRGTYCHVDKSNNVYLAGRTLSTSGIATTGAHQTTHGGDPDAFLVKFNASGTRQWATYYGGSNIEEHVTCATDTGLNIYLAGTTQSNNNIFSTGGFQSSFGGFSDAFLVKFNASGVRQWGTFYGGTLLDEASQCAVDKNGNVYLGGTTRSTSNIASGGFQNTKNNSRDGFIVKFTSSGTRSWASYYGGEQDDYGNSVCVDTLLNVYLSGFTYSTNSIASGGFQNTFGGSNDAYLVKFNTSGTRLWATYYGGSNGDYGPHCITDKSNNVYLTGHTLSTNAIAFGGIKNVFGGSIDGYVVKFNPSGSRLWGTYYGGTNDDYLLSSVPDGFGNIYYAGQTLSNSLIASGGHQNTFGGAGDVFLVKMSEDPTPYIEIFSNKGDTICQGDTILFTKNDINGGSNPRYRWYRNNVLVDTTPTYRASGFVSGDSVKCRLLSNASGLLYDTAWSIPIRFFVHPKKFTTLNINLCKPQTYYFKSQTRSTTGTYYDTLQSSKGCDSIVTLNLTIKDTSFGHWYDTICANQTYFFNGFPRSVAGLYKDTLINVYGCDSFVYLHLHVKSISSRVIDSSICPSNPYFFNGSWRSSSGAYHDTLVNSIGCDSFITLNLTVKPTSNKTIDTAICSGYSFWFKGQSRTATGVYRDTLINALGCDSIIILNLTIKSISTTNLASSICDNESYFFKGQPRTSSGIYRDTLINSIGCDSIVILNLTVKSRSYYTIHDTICSNQSYFFGGNNLNTTGIFYDTLTNAQNCDSIINLYLYVKNLSSNTIFHTICSNESFFFNGLQRTLSGTYHDTLVNSKGCDSFLTLILTVNASNTTTIEKDICLGDSFLFNGIYLKTAGLYKDTLINQYNCDSFIDLQLIVRLPSTYAFSLSQCRNQPFVFNGSILSSSGTYRDTMINHFGCDSFIILNFLLIDTSSVQFSATICQGESYIFNGIPRFTSGVYKQNSTNFLGCDSIITLNLTVNPKFFKIIDTNICSGSSVFFKGNYLSTPGTYRDSLKTIHNCDSIVEMRLQNYPPTSFTIYRKFCSNGGVWFNGSYRNAEGSYFDTFVNSKGCDSFVTMILYKDTVHKTNVSKSICSYDSILINGKYIRQSGIYLDTLVNSGGCDSIVQYTITAHIPKPISLSKYNATVLISDLGFQNYSWYLDGQILPKDKRHYLETNKSGTYYVIGLDSNLCYSKSNLFSFSFSSIQAESRTDWLIYPIPAQNFIYISSANNSIEKCKLSMHTLDGKIILENELILDKTAQIDISDFVCGTYVIKITSNSGVYTQTVLVK